VIRRSAPVVVGVVVAVAGLAHAHPGDRPSEDELFGAPAPQAPSGETATPTGDVTPLPDGADRGNVEEALFGGGATPNVTRDAAGLDDKLAIGGRLLLRAQAQVYSETDADDQPLTSPNLLDVYLDARPVERLRGYAEFRVTYDPTLENGRAALPDLCDDDDPDVAQCRATADAIARAFATPAADTELTQLWIKTDVARQVFLTIGKQPIRWGAGHIWNPTDFVNRTKRDPLTTFDLRAGVSLVKVHVPFESAASSLYAIGILDEARALGQVGGAARAEIGFSQAELTLSAAARRGQPLLLGGDLSFGLGPFDFIAEAAVAHGNHDPLPGDEDRDDDWIPQVTAGVSAQIDYGDEDSLVLGVEYFHNGDGVDDPARYAAAIAAGRSPFDLPRHAAGAFLLVAAPGEWDDSAVFATAIASLDDGSITARVQWTQRVVTWLDVIPYAGGYFGDRGDLFRPSGFDAATLQPTEQALTAEAGVWLQMAM
jgi:hypothetical protein